MIGGVCSHGEGADHTPIPVGSKVELFVTGGEFHSEQAKMAFWGVEAYSPALEAWRTLPHL